MDDVVALRLSPVCRGLAIVFIFDIFTFYVPHLFFFFSSRRRHTRLTCDWSSDVSLPILPSDLVMKTSTSPPGRLAAPGSEMMPPGGTPAPTGPPHCHPPGAVGCCQACTTWLAAVRANTIRSPFASAATAGLLAILCGELPTACTPDQVGLPT